MPAGNIKEVERVDDEFIPVDARPVCPNCFKPCHPLQNYCNPLSRFRKRCSGRYGGKVGN